MRFLKVLLLLAVSLFVLKSKAQDINLIMDDDSKRIGENRFFISKEASQFVKVNNIPMDLYAGKLDIEIPLYEIREGDITVPISLKYLSGGVKVDEEASVVGLNWVLSAGGSVNKMVRDIEDHKMIIANDNGMDPSGNDLGFSFKGKLVKSRGSLITNKMIEDQAPYTSTPNRTIKDINNEYNYTKLYNFESQDLLPDLFYMNAPGLNSSFTVERASNNSLRVKEVNKNNNQFQTLKYEKFSVDYLGDNIWLGTDLMYPRAEGSEQRVAKHWSTMNNYSLIKAYSVSDYEEFNVVNTSGLKYLFKTNDINVYSPIANYDMSWWSMAELIDNPYVLFIISNYSINKGTWHLDEIEDPNTGRKVNFKYSNYISKEVNRVRNHSHLFKVSNSGSFPAVYSQTNFLIKWMEDWETNQDESYLHKNVLKNHIREITWSEGKVSFYYQHNRTDVSSLVGLDKALSRIEVKDSFGAIVKTIEFEYGNFGLDENSVISPKLKRLKLNGITEMSPTGAKRQLYKFEYDESKSFAEKDSFKKDFLGFFNGNVSSVGNAIDIKMSVPQIYFSPGKGRNSFIPFAHPNYMALNYGYSLASDPNSASLGSLVKIVNELGATNEFIYEPNEFYFDNYTVKGGGIRVKSQIIKDNGVVQNKIHYKYTDEDGKSSGRILAIPNYVNVKRMSWSSNTFAIKNMDCYIYNGVTHDVELTRGGSVGYKKVTVEEEGLGRTENYFTSSDDYPNEHVVVMGDEYLGLVKHSSFGTNYYWDNDFQRASLLRKKIFGANNQLKKEEIYNYETKTTELNPLIIIKKDIGVGNYYAYSLFKTMMLFSPFRRIKNFNLVSKEENFYEGGKLLSKKTSNLWNEKHNFLEEVLEEEPNGVTKTVLRYPNPGPDIHTHLPKEGSLYLQNRISKPLILKKYKGSSSNDLELISEEAVEYGGFNRKGSFGDQVFKKSVYSKKGIGSNVYLEENKIVSYDLYDSKGNLLQYTDIQGKPTSLIWSYYDNLPVIKMEGLPYSTLTSNEISFLKFAFDNNEMDIIYQITNGLRNIYKDAFISTYIYKPLVGLKQTIDPKGLIETYEYDEFNRLKKILDSEGNILQEFEYNIR